MTVCTCSHLKKYKNCHVAFPSKNNTFPLRFEGFFFFSVFRVLKRVRCFEKVTEKETEQRNADSPEVDEQVDVSA